MAKSSRDRFSKSSRINRRLVKNASQRIYRPCSNARSRTRNRKTTRLGGDLRYVKAESLSGLQYCALVGISLAGYACQHTNFEIAANHFDIQKLQVEDFRNVLGDEFVARYINILPELKATGSNKLYCKHSMLKEDRDPQQRGSSPPEGVVLALSEQAIDAATTADDKSTVPCGAFIEKDDKKPPVQTCYHCNGRVCTLCGLPLRSSDKHDCVTPEEVTHEYIEKGKS